MTALIICQILILFLSLIFTEIIEINCLGLSKNTKKNISLRAMTNDSKILDVSDNQNEDFEIEETISKYGSQNEVQIELKDKTEECDENK